MKMLRIAFLMLMFSSLAFAGGPTGKFVALKGKVSDSANHELLAGVKVSVKGTSLSTYTDFEGNFTLILPAGTSPVLEFEALSYQPLVKQATDVSGQSLQIELSESR